MMLFGTYLNNDDGNVSRSSKIGNLKNKALYIVYIWKQVFQNFKSHFID